MNNKEADMKTTKTQKFSCLVLSLFVHFLVLFIVCVKIHSDDSKKSKDEIVVSNLKFTADENCGNKVANASSKEILLKDCSSVKEYVDKTCEKKGKEENVSFYASNNDLRIINEVFENKHVVFFDNENMMVINNLKYREYEFAPGNEEGLYRCGLTLQSEDYQLADLELQTIDQMCANAKKEFDTNKYRLMLNQTCVSYLCKKRQIAANYLKTDIKTLHQFMFELLKLVLVIF